MTIACSGLLDGSETKSPIMMTAASQTPLLTTFVR